MTRKVKKTALGVACALLATVGAVGVVSLTKPTAKLVSAEGTTFTVDDLGNATWDVTANATAYQWSYTVDGIVYPAVYTTVENGAFIGEALTKAAEAAVAKNKEAEGSVTALDIQLNVAPIVDGAVGKPVTLAPATDITQYIDYTYETHDITEYSTNAQGDGYEFGAASKYYDSTNPNLTGNVGQSNATQAMHKNQLLTFGLNRVSYSYKSYYYNFGFFGGADSEANNASQSNYHLQIRTAAASSVIATFSANGVSQQTWSNSQLPLAIKTNYTNSGKYSEYGGTEPDHDTNKTYNANNYITAGVFDVKGLDGEKIGERFYFDIDMEKNGAIIDIATISEFVDKTITDELKYTGTTAGSNGSCGLGSTNFNISASYCKATLHSGVIEDETPSVKESPITGVYYDNSTATIHWDKVEGADGYKYAIGNGAWNSVSTNYVSVTDELASYSDYMPVKILAIVDNTDTKEVYYNARMGYQGRSVVNDLITEVRGTTINDSYTDGITAPKANWETDNYMAFSFTADGTKNAFLALFARHDATEASTSGCYSVNFWNDGILTVGMDSQRTWGGDYNLDIDERDLSKTVASFDVLEAGTKYFVTFGVDDLYEGSDIVGEYVTLRVAVQDGVGVFKTIVATNFENTQCGETQAHYVDKTGGYYTLSANSGFGSSIVYDLEKSATTIDLEEGAIGANAYMNIAAPNRNTLEKLQMKTVYNGDTAVDSLTDLPEAQTEDWKAGLYKFTQYVPAKEIDENVSLELYVGNKAGGVAYKFTVRDYINAVQETYETETANAQTLTYSKEVYDLVTAIEDYCDTAAVYFGVEGATIAESSRARIEAVEGVFTKEYAVSGTDETIENVGFSLFTESRTIVRLYLQATAMPTVTATVGGETREVSVQTMESGNTVYYYVDVEVNAFELDSDVVFTINSGATFTCSALTYGTYMDTNNVNLVNVVKALYLYAQKANAYYGA